MDKEQKAVWPYPTGFKPVTAGTPGGKGEPPEKIKDVAVLTPYSEKLWPDIGDMAIFLIPGLDGSYILSSDGSTRPYGKRH